MFEDFLFKDSNEMIESVFGLGKVVFIIMLFFVVISVFDELFLDLNWGFVIGLEDKKVVIFGVVDYLFLMLFVKNKEFVYKLI